MKIGIDFGITHTDVAITDDKGTNFQTFKSLKINQEIKCVFDSIQDPQNIKKIYVTGGKSSDLPDTFNGLPVSHKNEIDSIALGAKQLYGFKESALIVSTGTGTACVHFDGVNGNHMGGIAVGGGMLCGLGNLLFKNGDALEIDEFQKEFIRGLSSKSIGVLESLLNAESENVRLNACKLVLDCNGYTNDTNVNVKVNHSDLDSKTDEELIAEFDSLIGRRPKVKEH